MAQLDKSKPYGTVHGLPGVMYDQDSKVYGVNFEEVNIDGTPIEEADEEVTTEPKAKAAAKPKAKSAVQAAVEATNALTATTPEVADTVTDEENSLV